MQPCIECGAPTNGTRCAAHERQRQRVRNARRTHYHGDWSARSRAARAAHLEAHGPVCPGFERPAHEVDPSDLTLDHINPRRPDQGFAVLCRSCNSRKGGR